MRSSRGWVLPCEIKKRARRARYRSAMETISGGHGGGALDDGEVVVARLGGVDSEIERGVGFALRNQKASALCSVLVCNGSDWRGSW